MFLQGADQLSFGFFAQRPVVVQRYPGQVSSDAGLLPIREFDERRQYTARMAACLSDARTAPDHAAISMLRQRLYGILADYEDCNDHDALRHDADLSTLRVSDVVFWVEGLEFAGEVKLRADLINNLGAATCTDQLQLKVSPLILMGHDRPALRSFVSRVDWDAPAGPETLDSTDYCTNRFPDATPPGIVDEVISPAASNGDQWAQDQFQIGFQSARYGTMYVVLDSKRDRGLKDFPETLLGPDYGHIMLSDGISLINSLARIIHMSL